MKRIKKLLKKEDGVSMVIVALMLVVLLGMAGLALDVGCAYYNKTKLQATCDATALAAVQKLMNYSVSDRTKPQNKNESYKRGIECFKNNFTAEQLSSPSFKLGSNIDTKYVDNYACYHYDKSSQTLTSSGELDTIVATSTMESPTIFAKLLGFDHFNITVKSTAYGHTGMDSDESIVTNSMAVNGNGYSNKGTYEDNKYGGIRSKSSVTITGPTTIEGGGKIRVPAGVAAPVGFEDKTETCDDFEVKTYTEPVKDYIHDQRSNIESKFTGAEGDLLNDLINGVDYFGSDVYSDVTVQGNKKRCINGSSISFYRSLTVGGSTGGGMLTVKATGNVNFNGNVTVKKGSILIVDAPSGTVLFGGANRITVENGAYVFFKCNNVTSSSLDCIVLDGTLECETIAFQMSSAKIMTSQDKVNTSYFYISYPGGVDLGNYTPSIYISAYDREIDNMLICNPTGTIDVSGDVTKINGAIYSKKVTFSAHISQVVKKKPFDHEGKKAYSLIA